MAGGENTTAQGIGFLNQPGVWFPSSGDDAEVLKRLYELYNTIGILFGRIRKEEKGWRDNLTHDIFGIREITQDKILTSHSLEKILCDGMFDLFGILAYLGINYTLSFFYGFEKGTKTYDSWVETEIERIDQKHKDPIDELRKQLYKDALSTLYGIYSDLLTKVKQDCLNAIEESKKQDKQQGGDHNIERELDKCQKKISEITTRIFGYFNPYGFNSYGETPTNYLRINLTDPTSACTTYNNLLQSLMGYYLPHSSQTGGDYQGVNVLKPLKDGVGTLKDTFKDIGKEVKDIGKEYGESAKPFCETLKNMFY